MSGTIENKTIPVKGVQEVKISIYKDPMKAPSVIPSPTGNCQMFCVIYMNALLGSAQPKKELVELLGENRKYVGNKKLLLCDIKQSLIDRVAEIFGKKAIVGELPYVSTNNSEMCIVLLNMEKVLW